MCSFGTYTTIVRIGMETTTTLFTELKGDFRDMRHIMSNIERLLYSLLDEQEKSCTTESEDDLPNSVEPTELKLVILEDSSNKASTLEFVIEDEEAMLIENSKWELYDHVSYDTCAPTQAYSNDLYQIFHNGLDSMITFNVVVIVFYGELSFMDLIRRVWMIAWFK